MKNIRSKALSLSLLMLTSMIFSGCSKKDDKPKPVPITEIVRDKEKIEGYISATDNLKVSDDLRILIPDAENVYTFTTKVSEKHSFGDMYEKFLDSFKATFPDHEINEEKLYYLGGSSILEYNDDGEKVSDYKTVKEMRSALESGSEECLALIYDDTWREDVTEWNDQVSMSFGLTLEYDTFCFNKGKYIGSIGKNTGVYPSSMDSFSADISESLGTYSPVSEKCFRLADKETSIKEAVDNFIKKSRSLKYPDERSFDIAVHEVEVLPCGNDANAYLFQTGLEYKGIPFNYERTGSYTTHDEYYSSGSSAIMVESSAIDIMSAFYRANITDEEAVDIIPIEAAIKTVSNEMTKSVYFEVISVELVYVSNPKKIEGGYIDINDPQSKVTPSWKILLYNPLDTMTYICNVNATDGEGFRYKATPADLRLLQ